MKNNMRKLLSFILCIVLIAAMALLATGCTDNKKETPKTPDTTQATTSTAATKAPATSEVITKGEGQTSFNFEVTDLDGKTTKFLIKTDKETVGAALLELKLIEESKQSSGMFVVVNGISADYNKDGAWWAFNINGKMAAEGANTTKIEPNATYSFVKTPA